MTALRMILMGLTCVSMALVVSGCSSMKPKDFANTTPVFRIEDYFPGHTHATGLFEDRFGKVRRRFTVDITGEWDGQTLKLVEDFVYDDGEKEQRLWTIRKLPDGSYEGTGPNVVGVARGIASGSSFSWKYGYDLKVGDDVWRVGFDDWMFMMPDGIVLNRATITRWGIEIGTVTIAFTKPRKTMAQETMTPDDPLTRSAAE